MVTMKLLQNWNGLAKGSIIEAGPGRVARLSQQGIAVVINEDGSVAPRKKAKAKK